MKWLAKIEQINTKQRQSSSPYATLLTILEFLRLLPEFTMLRQV